MKLIRSVVVCVLAAAVLFQPAGAFARSDRQEASTPGPEQASAFGVLARLAGSQWLGAVGAHSFDWVDGGSILRQSSIAPGQEYAVDFEISNDGQTILMGTVGTAERLMVRFPSADSYEVFDLNGNFNYGCQLSPDAQTLPCNQADGRSSQIQRVTLAAYYERRNALLAQQVAARQSLVSGYGDFAPFVFARGNDGQVRRVAAYFIATQTLGNRINGPIPVRIGWDQDDVLTEWWQRPESSGYGEVSYSWEGSRNAPGTFRRDILNASTKEFTVQADGSISGVGRLRNENILTVRFMVYQREGDGLALRLYQGRELRPERLIEEYILQPSTKEIYDRSLAAFRQRQTNERLARSQDSSGGIGGLLAGALIGGALTNGSPEGIIAGARAMAPSDATRQQLDAQAADLAYQREREAADNAAFQAQLRETQRRAAQSRASSAPGGSGNGAASFSAQVAPQSSTASPGAVPPAPARQASEQRMQNVLCIGTQEATEFRSGSNRGGNREVLRRIFVHYTSRIGRISSEPGYTDTLGRLGREFTNRLPSIEGPDRYLSLRDGYCYAHPSYDQILTDIEESKRYWESNLASAPRDLVSYENVLWTPEE